MVNPLRQQKKNIDVRNLTLGIWVDGTFAVYVKITKL